MVHLLLPFDNATVVQGSINKAGSHLRLYHKIRGGMLDTEARYWGQHIISNALTPWSSKASRSFQMAVQAPHHQHCNIRIRVMPGPWHGSGIWPVICKIG